MSCPFQVGQEIICINESWVGGYGNEQRPHRGHLYTIREIRPDFSGTDLLLIEVRNPIRHYRAGVGTVGQWEAGWIWQAFRALNEREETFKHKVAAIRRVTDRHGDAR